MTTRINVRQEGKQVILIGQEGGGGEFALVVEWSHAIEIGKALIAAGRLGEEYDKADQIALDSAALIRSGLMIRLANNTDIHKMAMHEAQWNSDLRRYIPQAPNIRSDAKFGVPRLKHRQNGNKD